jgi:hypothetical protein
MCRALRFLFAGLVLYLGAFSYAAAEASRAEGFTGLPTGSKVAVMPLDIELFELGAGGIREPQAEWTAQAHQNFARTFQESPFPNTEFIAVGDGDDRDIEALNRLHGAVGTAIVIHHTITAYKLPTKQGRLDWSLGDSLGQIREKTGARYTLFTYVRDSYASGGRVAAIVVGAILGVGLTGGVQAGYASLVDLETGRIVWFNPCLSGCHRHPLDIVGWRPI